MLNNEHPKIKKRLLFPNLEMPSSFSLVNLHKHILGVPPIQAHGAEADCLALLRITSTLGSDWIIWVKENCYLSQAVRKCGVNKGLKLFVLDVIDLTNHVFL